MCKSYPAPRFQHDCQCCTYLGQHENADLYFCKQGGLEDTVIARYSGDGPDYSSGMIFGRLGVNPALATARQRAMQAGLTTG